MLLLICVMALLTEPLFTMAPEPGDLFAAEVFRSDGVLTNEEIAELLGGGTVADDVITDVPGAGRVRVVSGLSAGQERVIVLAPLPDGVGRDDRVCRISPQASGSNNNAQRATRWCLSFIGTPSVVIRIPPRNPSAAPDRP